LKIITTASFQTPYNSRYIHILLFLSILDNPAVDIALIKEKKKTNFNCRELSQGLRTGSFTLAYASLPARDVQGAVDWSLGFTRLNIRDPVVPETVVARKWT
jgi:hypothetical protein